MRCEACLTAFDKNQWTATERNNKQKQGTALVCKECRSQGYSPSDLRKYRCQHCKKEAGGKCFDSNALLNYKYHGLSKLVCKTCEAEIRTRTTALQKKLKSSKRVCKCFCPIHRDKCPLSPAYYRERRWPGSDG